MGGHALNGRLKINVISDNLNRFRKGNHIFIFENNDYKQYTIEEFKQLADGGRICLLRINGVFDRTAAQAFKGKEIFITQQEAEETRDQLEENDFYYFDLVGCEVFLDNKKFAEVTDILQAGSGEILILTDMNGKQLMIPFIDSMVDTSRIKEMRLDIYPIEGLFDI